MNEELKAAIKEAVREAIAEASIALQYDGWMTLDEAANYTKRSKSLIEKAVKRNRIPFHRGGKGQRIVFRKSELDQWLINQGNQTQERKSVRERVAQVLGRE